MPKTTRKYPWKQCREVTPRFRFWIRPNSLGAFDDLMRRRHAAVMRRVNHKCPAQCMIANPATLGERVWNRLMHRLMRKAGGR